MRLMRAMLVPALLATFAVAGLSSADASTTSSAAAAGLANCTYRVTRTVAVYELPTNASPRLKFKHRGDRVRGFRNLTYYNDVEDVRYRAVDIKRAADDIGWMNARALRLIRCDR